MLSRFLVGIALQGFAERTGDPGFWNVKFVPPLLADVSIVFSLIGFPIAIVQLIRTRRASLAAKAAAEEAAFEGRKWFRRYAALAARNLIDGVTVHVQAKQWVHAGTRLGDLARYARDLAYNEAPVDAAWISLSQSCREWSASFHGKKDGSSLASSQTKKWADFLKSSNLQIDGIVGVFYVEEGEPE